MRAVRSDTNNWQQILLTGAIDSVHSSLHSAAINCLQDGLCTLVAWFVSKLATHLNILLHEYSPTQWIEILKSNTFTLTPYGWKRHNQTVSIKFRSQFPFSICYIPSVDSMRVESENLCKG